MKTLLLSAVTFLTLLFSPSFLFANAEVVYFVSKEADLLVPKAYFGNRESYEQVITNPSNYLETHHVTRLFNELQKKKLNKIIVTWYTLHKPTLEKNKDGAGFYLKTKHFKEKSPELSVEEARLVLTGLLRSKKHILRLDYEIAN